MDRSAATPFGERSDGDDRSASAGPRALRSPEQLAHATLTWRLTPRQAEILEHVVRGASNAHIARVVGCSAASIEAHVGQLLRKASAEGRGALVARFWTLPSTTETSPAAARALERATEIWALTPMQARVLEHVVRGASNKDVMAVLGCAKSTIEAHVTALLRKSGCVNRAELIARFWWGATRGA
ncbi:response regulator transcription factor [Sandaracinus amylolyticus]|uniref:Transcriptional regulator, LuxR family protein n=1 Tax=Sandaracinus amylolyticus TaxID=927083 RepID=A0A0F6VZU9_9BACT|nr:helix-turn-helix transcriptional regulator [Sandaracinus amylolyticus]AKF03855.1 Transcriptional regulator, LuxR family protein [Sandaracinus amylolyticus]